MPQELSTYVEIIYLTIMQKDRSHIITERDKCPKLNLLVDCIVFIAHENKKNNWLVQVQC